MGISIKIEKSGIVVYSDINGRSIGVFSGHGGTTFGPFVFIRAKHIEDRGLLEHELVHTRQFWNPKKWFWGKLRWEVEAYKEQLKWYPDDKTEQFARALATKYGLNISVEAAILLLKG